MHRTLPSVSNHPRLPLQASRPLARQPRDLSQREKQSLRRTRESHVANAVRYRDQALLWRQSVHFCRLVGHLCKWAAKNKDLWQCLSPASCVWLVDMAMGAPQCKRHISLHARRRYSKYNLTNRIKSSDSAEDQRSAAAVSRCWPALVYGHP